LVSSIDCTVRESIEPSNTIVSVGDGHSVSPRAWLSAGRVVRMTPRALARFQSIPDSYILPDNNKLACTVIGNGVCPLLYQRIIEQFQL
jgi:site-specific DNA-cytosine methylase